MAKTKPEKRDELERLNDTMEQLGEVLATVGEKLEKVVSAIDDLRSEIEWRNNNQRRPAEYRAIGG